MYLLTNPETGERYPIRGLVATIGRSADCDVVLDREPGASRQHARLERSNRGWYLVDLGSTNGTLVNAQTVDSIAIKAGDLIRIGETCLRFDDFPDTPDKETGVLTQPAIARSPPEQMEATRQVYSPVLKRRIIWIATGLILIIGLFVLSARFKQNISVSLIHNSSITETIRSGIAQLLAIEQTAISLQIKLTDIHHAMAPSDDLSFRIGEPLLSTAKVELGRLNRQLSSFEQRSSTLRRALAAWLDLAEQDRADPTDWPLFQHFVLVSSIKKRDREFDIAIDHTLRRLAASRELLSHLSTAWPPSGDARNPFVAVLGQADQLATDIHAAAGKHYAPTTLRSGSKPRSKR